MTAEAWQLLPAGETVPIPLRPLWEKSGRLLPTVETELLRAAGRPGAYVRQQRLGPRHFEMALLLQETDDAALRARARELAAALNPLRGLAELQLFTADGGAYRTRVYVSDGLRGIESDATTVGLAQEPVVLTAPDPMWETLDPVTFAFLALQPSTQLWLEVGLIPTVVNTTVAGGQVITVAGDDPVWPTLTVTGPGDALEAKLSGVSSWLMPTLVIAAGEVVTIGPDDDGVMRATSTVNGDVMGTVALTSQFWQLQPGANTVDVRLNNASAASSVVLSWRPRSVAA